MKYAKLFENHTYYEQYINSKTAVLPNVSYCINEVEVHYNPVPPHDYSQDYLTTIALENGTISFNILRYMGTDMITSISYSLDNGESWTTTNNIDNKEEELTIQVEVSEGDKVLWKGNAKQLGFYEEEDWGEYIGSFFSSNYEFNVQGNVMSMLYGDDFIDKYMLNYDGEFARLFCDIIEGNYCSVVSAEHMVLPATTLTNNCYRGMFEACDYLTIVPELPATTLTDNCYMGMFSGCTSLTTAPELPATTLASECYSDMFSGCTSLTTAPELPATTLAMRCYHGMFQSCTSLTTTPELPATTLANGCYEEMFGGCTSLTTAPELPVTTLADWCYRSMFSRCTSLTTAPELPATTLTNYCYSNMFAGCTSLMTAPELPATSLANSCYISMFSSCTSLITAPSELPATILTDHCCSGMFKSCTSLTVAPELPATTLANWCYSEMFENCTSLMTAPELLATTLVEACYAFMFQGCTSLNSIKCLATNRPNGSTYNWVSSVASSGTFTKAASMSSWPTGVHGIPSGWDEVDV